MGVDLDITEWDRVGHGIGLMANVQPSGEYLGEEFHRAGGVPAIMGELLAAGKLHPNAITVTGGTVAKSYGECRTVDPDVIRPYDDVLMEDAGFMALSGNLFSSAIIKTSVISDEFRARFLNDGGGDGTGSGEGTFTATAVVFDGPEDYRARIEDPDLGVTVESMLVVRGAGPIGHPGSAEVVNMHPPGHLIQQGVRMLPCMGDGRQSGTSDNPSILNVTPEAAAGGNIAILETGDRIHVDLNNRSVQLLVDDEEIARRWSTLRQSIPVSNTPWEELFRAHVTQLAEGYYLDWAVKYHDVGRVTPRHSH